MNKIREALEALVGGKKNGLFSCDVEAGTEEELEVKIEDARERWARAEAALSAPVASDARELARKLAEIDDSPHARYSDAYFTEAAALVERFVAERERKAREEIDVLREGIALAKGHLVLAWSRAGSLDECRAKINHAQYVLENAIHYKEAGNANA